MSTPASSSSSLSDDSGCKLGRHEYWEATYATELANLSVTGDEGEVWFGEDVNEAAADFAAAQIGKRGAGAGAGRPDPTSPLPQPPPRIVDVGCGNGALVFALADRGFGGPPPADDPHPRLPLLVGLDYSPAALALAAAVAGRRGLPSAALLPLEEEEGGEEGEGEGGGPPAIGSPAIDPAIGWVVADLVQDGAGGGGAGGRGNGGPLFRLPRGAFDAATDKGTLDAVGLSAGGPPARRAYLRGVAALLKPGGLFIVTSCNATLAELRRELCGDGDADGGEGGGGGGGGGDSAGEPEGGGGSGGGVPAPPPPPPPLFSYVDHVRSYPTFKFGGVVGSRVATVAVRKL